MGWVSYHATPVRGKIDRKAEVEKTFSECYEILKSTMVGSTHYAALRQVKKCKLDSDGHAIKDETGKYILEDIPVFDQFVFASITLTSVDMNDYYNFSYKDMDETEGPCECDCPKSILDLLSPTPSKFANEWRDRCYKRIEQKKQAKSLASLPIGTRIRFTDDRGNSHILLRSEPCYQFKKPFWYDEKRNAYIRDSQLNADNTEILMEVTA